MNRKERTKFRRWLHGDCKPVLQASNPVAVGPQPENRKNLSAQRVG